MMSDLFPCMEIVTMSRDVLKEFVAWYRSLGVSERAIETAIDRLEDFVAWLRKHGRDLGSFDHRDVAEYLGWFRELGYSEATVYKSAEAIKKFLRFRCEFLEDEEACRVYEKVKLRRRRLPPPRVLDPRVIRDFIGKVSDLYWKTLFAVLYETGARVGEVVQLRIGDLAVDEYGFKVTIRRSKSEERTVRVTEYAPAQDVSELGASLLKWFRRLAIPAEDAP